MKNYNTCYEITYKNYHIIKYGDDYIITDEHGTTQETTRTQEDARDYIDRQIELKEQKQKTFDGLKELNPNTQKARNYIDNYNNSGDVFLRDVYGSYSREKERAYENCLKTLDTLDGYSHRITTASKFVFTFAFIFDFDGAKYLCYITPTQDYKIKLNN